MKLDCCIIASAHREALIRDHILPSVLRQGCIHHTFVVGDFYPYVGYSYLPVPAIHHNTLDALRKRQAVLRHSTADAILYLSDDHRLLDIWDTEWEAWKDAQWDVLVPARYAVARGGRVEINNGMDRRDPCAPYAAGHAAIYRRRILEACPWTEAPEHPNWDLWHSRQVVRAGGVLAHCADLRVGDIDPNPTEWGRHFTLDAVTAEG